MNPAGGSRWRLVVALSLVATLAGSAACTTGGVKRTLIDMETEFRLDSPNFRTTAVHVSGRAGCHYILFSIPLCRRQDIASAAWEQMRKEADLDGRSGQLINVFEDEFVRNNLFSLYFQEVYTVSADVIVFE
jgi:hypothetical protein